MESIAHSSIESLLRSKPCFRASNDLIEPVTLPLHALFYVSRSLCLTKLPFCKENSGTTTCLMAFGMLIFDKKGGL